MLNRRWPKLNMFGISSRNNQFRWKRKRFSGKLIKLRGNAVSCRRWPTLIRLPPSGTKSNSKLLASTVPNKQCPLPWVTGLTRLMIALSLFQARLRKWITWIWSWPTLVRGRSSWKGKPSWKIKSSTRGYVKPLPDCIWMRSSWQLTELLCVKSVQKSSKV